MSSNQGTVTIAQGGTYSITGAITFYMNQNVLSSTEANVQKRMVKCTTVDCEIDIFANTSNGSTDIALRIDGVEKAVVTYTTTETGDKTLVYSGEIADGALVCLEYDVQGTTGSLSFKPGIMHYIT